MVECVWVVVSLSLDDSSVCLCMCRPEQTGGGPQCPTSYAVGYYDEAGVRDSRECLRNLTASALTFKRRRASARKRSSSPVR